MPNKLKTSKKVRLRSYLICTFLLVFSLLGIAQTSGLRQANAAGVVDLALDSTDVGGANPSFTPASPVKQFTTETISTVIKNVGTAASAGTINLQIALPTGFSNTTTSNGGFSCPTTGGTITCTSTT